MRPESLKVMQLRFVYSGGPERHMDYVELIVFHSVAYARSTGVGGARGWLYIYRLS